MPESTKPTLNFSNTEIAFSSKSNKELLKTVRLFQFMNKPSLVSIFSKLGTWAFRLHLPFSKMIVKKTIYYQFCGGENILDCQDPIDKLHKYNALTILDYGAESKSTSEDFDVVEEETIKALELAASNDSVPAAVCKITGLSSNILLEKLSKGAKLSASEEWEYEKLKERLDYICERAYELEVSVFIDAEESWMQKAIDDLVDAMMAKYNQKRVTVYNTYQMYRHDRLQFLYDSYAKAHNEGYMLGAKVVRGAYMEKERARALEKGYPSPIQKDKESTDRDFDLAIKFCVENHEQISSCCATHNQKSSLFQADLIEKLGLDRSHRHLNFCQLYGMSDNITFNLAENGYNVAKYLVYGPVYEVIPFLMRRAQENTSVTGDMSRELELVVREKKRRGL